MSPSAEYLLRAFEEKKRKNPRYSLRAFAKHLEIGSGRLSEFLNGQRQISEEVGRRIAAKLNLTEEERQSFLHAIKGEEESGHYGRVLPEDEFKFLSDPYYHALLSLIETKGFDHQTATAARRLGLTEGKIREAVQILKNLNLLEEASGKLKIRNRKTQTVSEVPSQILRDGHKQRLKVVENAINTVPMELRDSSAITLAIDPKQLPLAKEKIKKFRRRLAETLEVGSKEEVYLFTIHLVPMTYKDF